MFPYARQAHRDLLDARVQRTGGYVDALEQVHLLGAAQAIQRIVLMIQRREGRPAEHLDLPLLPTAGDGAGGLRGLAQGIGSDRIAVGKAGLFPRQRPYAHALLEVEPAFLDDAILEHPGLGYLVLEIQVRGIHAGAGELTQQTGQIVESQASGGQQSLGDG